MTNEIYIKCFTSQLDKLDWHTKILAHMDAQSYEWDKQVLNKHNHE